jgi:phytanoyl-CoA hydroxylase
MVATVDTKVDAAKTAESPAKIEVNGTFDDNLSIDYDPGLYQTAKTVRGIDGWDANRDEQPAFFDEYGFLSIESAFTPEEVEKAKQGILDLIGGKYPGYRGVQFEKKARDLLPTLSPEEKQDVVRKVSHFHDYDPYLGAMAFHQRLIELVSRLMDDDVVLFESKALLKPPKIGREKPWHQDHAYFNVQLDAPVITAWIALDPATVDNGCLFVIPGSHREGPVVHFRRRDWQICDDHVEVGRAVAAPLGPGGVLVFHSYLHHGTPANVSPLRRRSLQFVYLPKKAAKIDAETRMAVFGSEGKDVTC